MARKKQYRPGIDDPPPSRLAWLAGLLGITAVGALLAGVLRRLKADRKR